jgi:tRNA(fMet)-specific endonuclease VapC
MLVLDTNHITELAYPSPAGERLRIRLLRAESGVFTTVITVEEELRGWLARLNRSRDAGEQIRLNDKLMERVNFFARWMVLPLDVEACAAFANFRRQGVRIATQDLRIACITIAHDATLLTRNTVDFAKVPGLRFENWLD